MTRASGGPSGGPTRGAVHVRGADRRAALGPRAATLGALAALAAVAWWQLGLGLSGLLPSAHGFELLRGFASRALTPALAYESPNVPAGAPPLLLSVLEASWRTVLFAVGGTSLALLFGAPLGLLASRSFWDAVRRASTGPLTSSVATAVWSAVRTLIAGLRSVHELLWAIVFLAAFGVSPFSAVVALALPYAGTLAKVFSEMLDEAPDDASDALRLLGATPGQEVLLGRAPRALADMGAYAFYRFECALRSSAVLGFFGLETLGYGLRAAFFNLQYGELWTHLWALIALVVAIEAWSGRLRRRFVA